MKLTLGILATLIQHGSTLTRMLPTGSSTPDLIAQLKAIASDTEKADRLGTALNGINTAIRALKDVEIQS